LVQWNIWGLDNVGKINADTTRNYYLKDHLGSIRVVLNSTNQVISAQDYDAWGYPLENRTYNATAMKYDFTGKERDNQTTYDYFGARYYDSRIANWTSIDPLFEKHFDYSPFNYVLRNPQRFFDPEGKQEELLGPGYMLAKYYIDVDNQKSSQIRDMNEDINASGLDMTQTIAKYGELAIEKYGGNLQPTNIEFDLVGIGGVFKSTLSMAKGVTGELSEGVSLAKGFTMTETIGTKISGRNISISMVNDALKKGEVFWDPKNKAFNYVLKNKISDGKHLIVGVTEKGAIKTAYPTNHIPYKRMINISQDIGISKGF
jgi:RHS repeat-associated protein